METLKPSAVQDIISEKGTASATVKLLKGNGKIRTITGMFKPQSDLELDESLSKQGRIPIYCMSENAWKSFKENRVLEIS